MSKCNKCGNSKCAKNCLTRLDAIDLFNQLIPEVKDGVDGNSIGCIINTILPGEECPEGGYAIQFGVDSTGNGQPDDINSVKEIIICNGEDGENGEDGKSCAVSIVELSEPTENCPNGGYTVTTGEDTTGDGNPDTNINIVEICNGEDGENGTCFVIDSSIDAESCGGKKIRFLQDSDCDGIADEPEVVLNEFDLCFEEDTCDGPCSFKFNYSDVTTSDLQGGKFTTSTLNLTIGASHTFQIDPEALDNIGGGTKNIQPILDAVNVGTIFTLKPLDGSNEFIILEVENVLASGSNDLEFTVKVHDHNITGDNYVNLQDYCICFHLGTTNGNGANCTTIRTEDASLVNCPDGGTTVYILPDSNCDGNPDKEITDPSFDPDVDAIEYFHICDGAPGPATSGTIRNIHDEDPNYSDTFVTKGTDPTDLRFRGVIEAVEVNTTTVDVKLVDGGIVDELLCWNSATSEWELVDKTTIGSGGPYNFFVSDLLTTEEIVTGDPGDTINFEGEVNEILVSLSGNTFTFGFHPNASLPSNLDLGTIKYSDNSNQTTIVTPTDGIFFDEVFFTVGLTPSPNESKITLSPVNGTDGLYWKIEGDQNITISGDNLVDVVSNETIKFGGVPSGNGVGIYTNFYESSNLLEIGINKALLPFPETLSFDCANGTISLQLTDGTTLVSSACGPIGGGGGGSLQNLFETIIADSGSKTASIPTDTLTINGLNDITTSFNGGVLEIKGPTDGIMSKWQIGINAETSGDDVTNNDLVRLIEGTDITITRVGRDITITSTAATSPHIEVTDFYLTGTILTLEQAASITNPSFNVDLSTMPGLGIYTGLEGIEVNNSLNEIYLGADVWGNSTITKHRYIKLPRVPDATYPSFFISGLNDLGSVVGPITTTANGDTLATPSEAIRVDASGIFMGVSNNIKLLDPSDRVRTSGILFGDHNTIGNNRLITGNLISSVIAGGITNDVSGSFSGIIGGANSIVNTNYSFIAGGNNNKVEASLVTIGDHSTIIGGSGNELKTGSSAIIASTNSTIEHTLNQSNIAIIAMGSHTVDHGVTGTVIPFSTYVQNLSVKTARSVDLTYPTLDADFDILLYSKFNIDIAGSVYPQGHVHRMSISDLLEAGTENLITCAEEGLVIESGDEDCIVFGNSSWTGIIDTKTGRISADRHIDTNGKGVYIGALGDDTALGENSFNAGGINNNNRGSGALSSGSGNTSTSAGDFGFVTGTGCTISNTNAVAFGNNNEAAGINTLALGLNTNATVDNSISTGNLSSSSRISEVVNASGRSLLANQYQQSGYITGHVVNTGGTTNPISFGDSGIFKINNNSVVNFELKVTATEDVLGAPSDTAVWVIKGTLIKAAGVLSFPVDYRDAPLDTHPNPSYEICDGTTTDTPTPYFATASAASDGWDVVFDITGSDLVVNISTVSRTVAVVASIKFEEIRL